MQSPNVRTIMLAGFTTLILAMPAFAFPIGNLAATQTSRATNVQYNVNKFECFTDDGYGRFRPCSSSYKRQHPEWRSSFECQLDDGYGRYRPCSQYKRKAAKR